MENNKKMAFWRYDLFPFVLSGEIVFENENVIDIKGYGAFQKWVIDWNPVIDWWGVSFCVLPYEQGLEIQKKLQTLKDERQKMLSFIEKGFNQQLKEIVKVLDLKK